MSFALRVSGEKRSIHRMRNEQVMNMDLTARKMHFSSPVLSVFFGAPLHGAPQIATFEPKPFRPADLASVADRPRVSLGDIGESCG